MAQAQITRRWHNTLRGREGITFYLFIAPWLVGFLVFTIGPLIASIVLSLADYSIVTPPIFRGLGNYRDLFTEDRLFGLSLYNTAYYVFFFVPLQIALSLGLALLLNQQVRGLAIYRTLFYIPSIVPLVANSILWIWILQPQWGLLNYLLSLIGVKGPLWLNSVAWSKPSLIMMSLWGSGGAMIIFLAGLQGIPQHLYEAAEIDGANRWRKFWSITIPLLTPTIFFVLVLGVIGSFQVFTQAYIMTGGGPADSTLFYMFYLYRRAFVFHNMGYASAMAWILFVIIFVLTLIQFTTARRWVYYEGERR
ncbi:MAG TPA: sugar ABC transporter permease [Caldilineaceae bacterium]|nr:sugar ABC transporter permease [Caldilineaceae bacterium]